MNANPQIPPFFEAQFERLHQNLARAFHLVHIYNNLGGKGKGRKSIHNTDLLRAAVVFTHASLEDFLRSLSAVYLPQAAPQVLDTIPLKGMGDKG